MTSAPGIGFEYRPSRWPLIVLAGLAALAILAIVISAAPWWLSLLLGIAVIVYTGALIRRTRAPGVRQVTWRADGGWQLQWRDRTDGEASLLDARVIGAIIILRLAGAGRRPVSLLLFPDNLDADTRRRLRMRLSVVADMV